MIPKIYFIKILLKNTANRCKYVQLLGGAKSDNWKIKHLSISFSDVDVINHFFGSSSLESEDIILKLDNTLVDLFEFIDQKIGLKHTLIILAVDHGMADMPEYTYFYSIIDT